MLSSVSLPLPSEPPSLLHPVHAATDSVNTTPRVRHVLRMMYPPEPIPPNPGTERQAEIVESPRRSARTTLDRPVFQALGERPGPTSPRFLPNPEKREDPAS